MPVLRGKLTRAFSAVCNASRSAWVLKGFWMQDVPSPGIPGGPGMTMSD